MIVGTVRKSKARRTDRKWEGALSQLEGMYCCYKTDVRMKQGNKQWRYPGEECSRQREQQVQVSWGRGVFKEQEEGQRSWSRVSRRGEGDKDVNPGLPDSKPRSTMFLSTTMNRWNVPTRELETTPCLQDRLSIVENQQQGSKMFCWRQNDTGSWA